MAMSTPSYRPLQAQHHFVPGAAFVSLAPSSVSPWSSLPSSALGKSSFGETDQKHAGFSAAWLLGLAVGVAAPLATSSRSHLRRQQQRVLRVASAAVGQSDPETSWQDFTSWASARGVKMASVSVSHNACGVRGLVAARDIPEGEAIIEVPITASVEVGNANTEKDPSVPALTLLRADTKGGDVSGDLRPYLAMLPRMDSADIMNMPDFFSESDLAMLQCPTVAEKTEKRRALCRKRAAEHGFSEADVKWALCTVVQRSFTVLSPIDGLLRLMLPGIDFFNHEIDSPHKLKVRWQVEGGFDGLFKVVAGAPIKAGEEICISYGGNPWRAEGCGGDCAGDMAWNNLAYLQKYGFVDTSLGTTMVDGKWLVSEQGASTRKALEATSIEQDEAALSDDAALSPPGRVAVTFRLHMKRALAAQLASQAAEEKVGNVAA